MIHRSLPFLAPFASDLADLVFPRTCVGCGEGVARGDGSPLRFVCRACAGALQPVRGPTCAACGHPLDPQPTAPSCPACERLPPESAPPWEAARSLFLHVGASRAMIVALKYHRATYLRRDFRTLLGLFPDLGAWVGDAVLVPVPTTHARRRARGLNQAAWIAARIREHCPRASLGEGLARILDTQSQTRLNRRLRSSNVSQAFRVLPRTADRFRGRDVVIVDDVFTTGATLSACASKLASAGPAGIRVLTWAHG